MQGQTYSGPERMLLIAFHLGVTCARVCYSILDPGAEIEIKDIQRFPKGGSSMVQCIVYYDKEGSVRAIGEIGPDPIQVIAREEKFLRVPVDWSTLQNTNENPGVTLPPLGKSPEDVLSDFLTYLKNEVHTYIRNDHPSIGIAVLDSATHYTFIAPSKMNETVIRVAAKKAEIIKDEKDTACMTFITEEEAYFETYLEERCDAPTGEERGVCIVNIDHALLTFSSFSYKSQPQRVEAITESQCDLKGYSVVKEEARAKITSLMKGSKLERKISAMLEYFDNTTKPAFREINRDPVVISFSGGKHRDLTRGIKAGKLYLDTNTVASFFEPLIKSIIEGVLAQNRVAREPIFVRHIKSVPLAIMIDETKKRLGDELPDVQVSRLDHPGASQVPRGGVARAIRSLHELIANASKKPTTDELPPAEQTQPTFLTSTAVPDSSAPEVVDEAKQALKILENIINTRRYRENQISELRKENVKLTAQAEIREREYLELQEKNIRLSIRIKELEEWREKVMMVLEGIQKKTHEIIGAECPAPQSLKKPTAR